jgi:hypothetical protein
LGLPDKLYGEKGCLSKAFKTLYCLKENKPSPNLTDVERNSIVIA